MTNALARALFQFYDLDAMKRRGGNQNVIVLITRGTPKDVDHAVSEARMLESRNVRLISVGVYSGRTASEHLKKFLGSVSYPKFTLLHSYRGLRGNRQTLLDAVCAKEDPQPQAGRKYLISPKSFQTQS
jgi:hypothetical protein